jgi:hypothetical protein
LTELCDSLAGLGVNLAVVLLAEVPHSHRFDFFDALSTDSSYLELIDVVNDLAKMTENTVNILLILAIY